MLVATAVAAIAAAPALVAAQAVERPFEKTLTVGGPVSLSVSSGSGSIAVSPGTDGSVRIKGVVRGTSWWRGASDAEVQRAVEAVAKTPPIVQRGDTIEIGHIEDRELANRVSISYEITVPKTTTLRAKTGSGSQQVGALAGAVTVSTGSGSVEVAAVDGSVDVSTGSGSIKVGGAQTRTSISTGSGAVQLGSLTGDVQVRTGSGSIRVDHAIGGKVEVSTGSGEITVSRLEGGLTARAASGTITVGGTPKADWDLQTSSGEIALDIPGGTAFSLQANTSSGSIDTDHALTVQSTGRRELIGTVGSGGSRVSARTASGSIRVRKR